MEILETLLVLFLVFLGVKLTLNSMGSMTKSARFETKTQDSARINCQEVVVIGVEMPFMSMVILLVKVSLAAIPAMLIVTLVVAFFLTIFRSLFHFIK